MAQGPGDPVARMSRVPGLYPGSHTLFELGDDLVGDAAVEIGSLVCVLLAHVRTSV